MFDLRESEDIEIWCFSYLGFWIKLEEIRKEFLAYHPFLKRVSGSF